MCTVTHCCEHIELELKLSIVVAINISCRETKKWSGTELIRSSEINVIDQRVT